MSDRIKKVNAEELRTELISAENEKIKIAPFVSGEMFDLTASSFNNYFGAKHNIGTITYGINFPLKKFIEELQKIIEIEGSEDDKTEKRRKRLDFLNYCNENKYVQTIFILFCNFLNGGSRGGAKDSNIMQQYNNHIIITAAGGNIIILFAQLLINMLDAFMFAVQKQDGVNWKGWDINDPKFETQGLNAEGYSLAASMFSKDISSLDESDKEIINKAYELLTITNKKLLTMLEETDKRNSKEQLYFLIVKYFIEKNDDTDNILQSIWDVASSNISDFDFKLSPNVPPMSQETYSVEEITSMLQTINTEQSAGFLLFRVKTLIDCREDSEQIYSTKDLKAMQRECADRLGPSVWGLYPQIMHQAFLNKVPKDSNCWKWLNYLNDKKEAIKEATNFSIDETMKFHQAGYYKQSNTVSGTAAIVKPAPNSTEAIINYISNITYNLNIYIKNWETVKDGKSTLSSSAAPALHIKGLPKSFSHNSVCNNFLSLNNILLEDDGLISRLAADIINYFLNDPTFHTEQILENLISSFKAKRLEQTKKESNCYMPPSDLMTVPTNFIFNKQFKKIKEVLNKSRYSELGFPDGIRITLNAIETTDKTVDSHAASQLDNIERNAQELASKDKTIEYSILDKKEKPKKKDQGEGKELNKKRGKKIKTQRRKLQKQKSKRQKNRKATLKHKIRKQTLTKKYLKL